MVYKIDQELEDLQHGIRYRHDIGYSFFLDVRWSHCNEVLCITFIVEWWPQYRTYIASPCMMVDNRMSRVSIEVSDAWARYIRHSFRRALGIRHVFGVNKKDNAERVRRLIQINVL